MTSQAGRVFHAMVKRAQAMKAKIPQIPKIQKASIAGVKITPPKLNVSQAAATAFKQSFSSKLPGSYRLPASKKLPMSSTNPFKSNKPRNWGIDAFKRGVIK